MDKTGVETPAGGLAAAVFLGGENIAPPKLPEVKPKPFVWAKVLAGAVIQAAKEVPRDKKKSCERQFLKIALDILESRTRWEPVASWREVIVRRDGR